MNQTRWMMIYCSALAAAFLATAPARAAGDLGTVTSADTATTSTLTGGNEDTDSDGVVDSEDNCPDVADSTQDDLDDDGVGDVCDSTDATLDANAQVKVKPASVTSSGSLTGTGTFTTTDAEDDSVDNSGEVTIEVTDSDSMDETVTVDTSECGESEDGGTVQCAAPAATVKLSRVSGTNTYRYKVRLRQLATETAPVAPVTLRVQHGAHRTDRVAELAACTIKGAKSVCSSN